MTTGGIRLDWKPIYLGSASIAFLIRQIIVFRMLLRFRMPPDHRIRILLFHHWAGPRSLIYALIIAALVTLLFQLLLLLVVAPLIRVWLRPRSDGTAALFRLSVGENVLESVPARRLDEGFWFAGTLILTNRSLWFIPERWDAEPWTVRLDAIRSMSFQASPPLAWGLIQGLPDHLVVDGDEGEPVSFAVSDTDALTHWLDAGIAASV